MLTSGCKTKHMVKVYLAMILFSLIKKCVCAIHMAKFEKVHKFQLEQIILVLKVLWSPINCLNDTQKVSN